MNLINRKYGNHKVYSPDGELMFLCNISRINWYLNRNLAILVSDNNDIKLNFQPKGLGYSDDEKAFFFTPKEDKCVCCGSEELINLTKHHIVPYCYRKWMPDEYKNHNCYDVVKLCRDCHNIYETSANILKIKIADSLNVNINNQSTIKISQIKSYARILLKHIDTLPGEIFEKMYNEISEYLGQAYLNKDELNKVISMNYEEDPDWKSWGQECIEKIDDLDDFIIMWRKHFIDTMKPEFMYKGWEIDKNLIRK